MSAETFRRILEEAAESAVSGHADSIASDVVAAVWNAVDDERGRLREDNELLRKSREATAGIIASRDSELASIRQRLAALHTKYPDSSHCSHDGEPWPCPTLIAVGTDGPRCGRARATGQSCPDHPTTAGQDTRKGEFISCANPRCRRGEWSAKAAQRGWEQQPDSSWLDPQCAADASERRERQLATDEAAEAGDAS